MIGQEKMTLSCARRGLDKVLGKKIMESMVKHWNRLLRKTVESSSLEVFKKCVDAELGEMA